MHVHVSSVVASVVASVLASVVAPWTIFMDHCVNAEDDFDDAYDHSGGNRVCIALCHFV